MMTSQSTARVTIWNVSALSYLDWYSMATVPSHWHISRDTAILIRVHSTAPMTLPMPKMHRVNQVMHSEKCTACEDRHKPARTAMCVALGPTRRTWEN